MRVASMTDTGSRPLSSPRVLGLLGALLTALVGCGSGNEHRTALADPDAGVPAGDGSTPSGDSGSGGSGGCADGVPGCPCTVVKDHAFCGWIKIHSGAYVACSPGASTCLDTKVWGECRASGASTLLTPDQIPPAP